MTFPRKVNLYEVGPRDGLQNEKTIVSLSQKIELILALIDAGYQDIEIGSFVKPSWIPQLADSDQVISNLPPPPEGVAVPVVEVVVAVVGELHSDSGFTLVINSLVTGRATSASNKANRISFKPESTCSSVNEGALFSLEKILSNLFVKFSNIFIIPNTYRTSGRTFAD